MEGAVSCNLIIINLEGFGQLLEKLGSAVVRELKRTITARVRGPRASLGSAVIGYIAGHGSLLSVDAAGTGDGGGSLLTLKRYSAPFCTPRGGQFSYSQGLCTPLAGFSTGDLSLATFPCERPRILRGRTQEGVFGGRTTLSQLHNANTVLIRR